MSESVPSRPGLSRRAVLGAGVVGGALVAAGALSTPSPASAHAAQAAGALRPSARHEPVITEIGPGIEQYSLMSGVVFESIAYIGSRNLEPTGIIAVDLASGRVVRSTTLATGHSIQALVVDPRNRFVYAGVLQKAATQTNLYRWRIDGSGEAEPLGAIGDRDVRDLAVSPDGTLFAVGGGGSGAPALWQYAPATGLITSLGVPDPAVTLARAVAASHDTVFFGAGSTLGGGGSASRAALYAYDRANGRFTDITPAEMRSDPSIRDLAVDGDRLLVSTAGATEPTKLAILPLALPATYVLAVSIGKTAKNFAVVDDTVFAANETGIVAWRPGSPVTQLPLGGVDLGEIWGVDARDGALVVASGYGFVAEVATTGEVVSRLDLGAAGAPVSAQACMGIAVGGGYAYVGGNGGIARHSLEGAPVVNLLAPGEAKDAEVIDGVLYTGQYSSQGIWSYDPRSGEPIRQVARFDSAQNRPLDTAWDAYNRLLLVAAQADTEGGGSLWTYDPAARASTIAVNPIDDVQLVRAVIPVDGVAYLGGDNAQKTGPRGTVVAWNPVTRSELWRIETGLPNGIAALESHGRFLFAWSIKGTLVVIDRPRRTIVHTADHRAICPGFAAMKAARGVIYGVSDTTLFRIDPQSFEVTVVVAGIDGGWYSGPHLNADEEGVIYTLRGRTLVAVDERAPRAS